MKLTRPNLEHMDRALKKSKGRKFFAYWMEPGTCKTAVTLQDAWRAFDAGEIDAVLVLAPNNVKDSWVKWPHMVEGDDVDETTLTLGAYSSRILKGLWISGATKDNKRCWNEFEDAINRRHHKLVILSANYEALLTEQFFSFLEAFCTQFRVMIVADESTRIGKRSERTKRAIKLARLCAMRRALSGTPVTKTPLKMHYQAKFLDEKALPYRTMTSFRNNFCVMGGFQGRQVLSYKNLPELSEWMDDWSFHCTKKEALDLPPQIFLKRRVYMTPQQTAAYKTMREEFFAEVDGVEVTAKIVLTQMMRLQQITGGYLVEGDMVKEIIPPDKNPKLLETAQLLEDAPGQCIVWFNFIPELEGMKKLLKPSDYFEFHGAVPEKDRPGIKAAFKRGDRPYLLGTEKTGGIGINQFLVADTVIHVSNDCDTEARIQADDRNHRMGSQMHEKITYYDVIVPNTVDVKILRIMRGDTQISAQVMRDQWREWV